MRVVILLVELRQLLPICCACSLGFFASTIPENAEKVRGF
jgi:hypothetical protein